MTAAGNDGASLAVNYGSGLTENSTGLIVDTNTIASVEYVDTNFVSAADLPGQLDDYVPLTQKGAIDGVATLDGNGQVPSDQLGNVPAAYITSVGNNLSVSNGVLDLGQYVAQREADWTRGSGRLPPSFKDNCNKGKYYCWNSIWIHIPGTNSKIAYICKIW